jgi:hypothetical protein
MEQSTPEEERSVKDYIQCVADFVSRVECGDDEGCQERKRKALECLEELIKLVEDMQLSDVTASVLGGPGTRICLGEMVRNPV